MNKDEFAAQTPFPIGQANDDYAQYFHRTKLSAAVVAAAS